MEKSTPLILAQFPILRTRCGQRNNNGCAPGEVRGMEDGIADAVNGAISYGEADPDVQAMVKHLALAFLYIGRLRQKGDIAG